MTATITGPAATEPGLIDISNTPKVGFGRLVRVEWRKMLDTRGGFWLLVSTAILLVLFMGVPQIVVSVDDVTMSASTWSQIMTIPTGLLLPVFAILTVTSEWSQRTNLVTFSLEPHRMRVVAAKLVAVCALAVATIALAVTLGAVGNLLAASIGGYDVVWNLEATRLLGLVGTQLLFFLMAFGLGTLLLNTPGAIALFYVFGLLLPIMVISSLYYVFDWADSVFPWVDLTTALMWWTSDTDYAGQPIGASAEAWAQSGVATLIWVVVPIALGLRRLTRAEVK